METEKEFSWYSIGASPGWKPKNAPGILTIYSMIMPDLDSLFTLPETNIATENQRLEDEFSIGARPIFRFHVKLPGSIISMVGFLLALGIFWSWKLQSPWWLQPANVGANGVNGCVLFNHIGER